MEDSRVVADGGLLTAEAEPVEQCARCGKELDPDEPGITAHGITLCRWCAFIEPQG